MKAVHWLRLLCFLSILVLTVDAACTWTERSKTKVASGGTYNSGGAESNDTCKGVCGDDCVAVYYDPGAPDNFRCQTFSTEPHESAFDDNPLYNSSYYTKTCVADTTAAPTTSAPDTTADPTTSAPDTTAAPTTSAPDTTADPTTSAPADSCTMTEVAGKAVQSHPYLQLDVTDSAVVCRRMCGAVSQCLAATYSAGTCQLHTASPSTASASGYTHYTKKACLDESDCCHDTLADTQGTSSGSVSVTLQSSAMACEAFCLGTSSCQALALSDNTCKMFTEQPTDTTQSGSTYQIKTCTGSDTSTLTLTDACDSAQTLHFSTLLVLLCLFAAVM